MKQVLQNLGDGRAELTEVPAPKSPAGSFADKDCSKSCFLRDRTQRGGTGPSEFVSKGPKTAGESVAGPGKIQEGGLVSNYRRCP